MFGNKNSFSDKFNKKPLEYLKAIELAEQLKEGVEYEDYGLVTEQVPVKNMWISFSSQYRKDGKSAVIELGGKFDGFALNAPNNMIPVIEDILKDGESLSLIARGKVGIELYHYENAFGDQIGVKWCDL